MARCVWSSVHGTMRVRRCKKMPQCSIQDKANTAVQDQGAKAAPRMCCPEGCQHAAWDCAITILYDASGVYSVCCYDDSLEATRSSLSTYDGKRVHVAPWKLWDSLLTFVLKSAATQAAAPDTLDLAVRLTMPVLGVLLSWTTLASLFARALVKFCGESLSLDCCC